MIKEGDKIAVWFSCGAASAIAAKRTIEKYGHMCDIRVVNNPVIEEHQDNRRFLEDVQDWLGVEIETAINPKYPACSAVEVWDKRQYMSGVAGAPCTLELKKKARQHWEKTNNPDWHVLGFTSEEKKRADDFIISERDNLIPVLVDDGISKGECFYRLQDSGIRQSEIYNEGYPNGNCKGCVKATSPTYWNHVRRVDPEVFLSRAEQSRRLGARLVRVKGERIFLDELDENAVGRPMKNLDFECGIFCEEKL